MGWALATLCFVAGVSAGAATISVTYSYTLTSKSGDPSHPPLICAGSESLLPLGDMAWSDRSFPDHLQLFKDAI